MGWRPDVTAYRAGRGSARTKTADRVTDLGPEDGDEGSRIVPQGTPEQVARISSSYLGVYLAPLVPRTHAKASRAGRDAGGGHTA